MQLSYLAGMLKAQLMYKSGVL